MHLVPAGEPRALPERILGASAEPFWKADRFLSDPERIAAVKSLRLGYVRFPGGSQSNYYDWKRGLFFVEPKADNSAYYERFVDLSKWVVRALPQGVSLEQYEEFSEKIGAAVILVPNLETASVGDQVEWFKHLAAKGAVPDHIELGNEFWGCMGQDPHVLKHWPDEPESMRIMRRYLEAFRPCLPKGVKVAVQAAAPSFRGEESGHSRALERLRQWNEDLKPEPWFDAVTIHLYPRLNEVLGRPDANKDPITPQIAERNLRALLARVDEGTDEALREVAERVPGKEIWVTEWNPMGAPGAGVEDRIVPTTPPLLLQLATRMTLAILRHPQVAISQYFSIRFPADDPHCMFLQGHEGYQPVPVAAALGWLNEAANGGATFQRFTEAGAPRIPGGGVRKESYAAVEAALFRGPGHATLILQNVSAEARDWQAGRDLKLGKPSRVEQLGMPDLADPKIHAAQVENLPLSTDIPVPPYSVTRVVWKIHGP